VVIRTFWWCYREEGGPRTCVFVSLEVPAALISFS
jgi:hypothetical protein